MIRPARLASALWKAFLREAAWFENAEEEVSELLLPIMVVSGLFDDQPEFSDIAADAKLVDDMVEQIPELLTALSAVQRSRRKTRLAQTAPPLTAASSHEQQPAYTAIWVCVTCC